jgi:hypothetical protein
MSPERGRMGSSLLLTDLLPASPVRKGGVKGSYTKMAIFLTGKPRPGGRGGFTLKRDMRKIGTTVSKQID